MSVVSWRCRLPDGTRDESFVTEETATMLAAFRARAARCARLAPPPSLSGASLSPSSSGSPSGFFPGALSHFVRGMANKGYVTMKRRFKGLYGGKHIKFGNTISFSHRKYAHTSWQSALTHCRPNTSPLAHPLFPTCAAQVSTLMEAERAKQALLLGNAAAVPVVPHDD